MRKTHFSRPHRPLSQVARVLWPRDSTTSANTKLLVPVNANNALFLTTLYKEIRGTFVPIQVRFFVQNLQHFERSSARFADAVDEFEDIDFHRTRRMFRTSREMLARETWEWLYLTEVLTVLTARSRGDKNGWKRVIKKMLTGSLSHFSRRHHRPLSQVARVLFSLCSFNTSPLYYLRAWHRLNFWHRADDFKAQHSQFSTCKPIGPTCNVAPVLEILGVPRLPPGDSLGTGKRGAVPKIWLAVPNF